MDVAALEQLLASRGDAVPLVMVTVTNNSGGGQPVSMANLRAVREVCDALRQAVVPGRLPIRRERVVHQDPGARLRGRTGGRHRPRDGVAGRRNDHVGEEGPARQHRRLARLQRRRARRAVPQPADPHRGLPHVRRAGRPGPGRDRRGLREAVDEDYLRYRIASVALPRRGAAAAGVPVVVPFGGHAVFIDAREMLPHIPPLAYPGQALACALYLEGGIRGCEIGTVMFGRQPDGSERPAPMDLVRLAVPRRTYTQSHIDYVIEVVERVAAKAGSLTGLEITYEPAQLRHFTARFRPLPSTSAALR